MIMSKQDRQGNSTVTFVEKLKKSIASRESTVCVGLDPDLSRLPADVDRTIAGVVRFNRAIIEATSDVACAYKPNFAFYECLGPDGFRALVDTLEAIPADVPVIADAKRGDIGNTAKAYAVAIFDRFACDAVTVSPYLGWDSVEPFLDYRDRGVFIVCRTSNPGAEEFQSLRVMFEGSERPLYQVVAIRARAWNRSGNVGLVVGATAPGELARIRVLAPELPILIPAVGAQGGDIDAAARAHRESAPAIVSASRSILYASSKADYAAAARRSAIELRQSLQLAGRA